MTGIEREGGQNRTGAQVFREFVAHRETPGVIARGRHDPVGEALFDDARNQMRVLPPTERAVLLGNLLNGLHSHNAFWTWERHSVAARLYRSAYLGDIPPDLREQLQTSREHATRGFHTVDLLDRFVLDDEKASALTRPTEQIDEATQQAEVVEAVLAVWRRLPLSSKSFAVPTLVLGQGNARFLPQEALPQAAAREILATIPLQGIVRENATKAFIALASQLDDVGLEELENIETTGTIIMAQYPVSRYAPIEEEVALGKSLFDVASAVEAARGTPLPQYMPRNEEKLEPEDIPDLMAAYEEALRQKTEGPQRANRFSSLRHVAARKDVIQALTPGRSAGEVHRLLQQYESLGATAVSETVTRMRRDGELPPLEDVAARGRIVNRLANVGIRVAVIAEVMGITPKIVSNDLQRPRAVEEIALQIPSTHAIEGVSVDPQQPIAVKEVLPTVPNINLIEGLSVRDSHLVLLRGHIPDDELRKLFGLTAFSVRIAVHRARQRNREGIPMKGEGILLPEERDALIAAEKKRQEEELAHREALEQAILTKDATGKSFSDLSREFNTDKTQVFRIKERLEARIRAAEENRNSREEIEDIEGISTGEQTIWPEEGYQIEEGGEPEVTDLQFDVDDADTMQEPSSTQERQGYQGTTEEYD